MATVTVVCPFIFFPQLLWSLYALGLYTCRKIHVAKLGSSNSTVESLSYLLWYKQCKSRRCCEVKLSPREWEVSKDTLTTPSGKPSAYGLGFAFGKSIVRLQNSLGSCESILGNLPRGQFYLPTPSAFTLFIPYNHWKWQEQ